MKKLISLCLLVAATSLTAQTVKSKALKLKYTAPEGWNPSEFGGKTSWDESGNNLCKCSGVMFTKQHKDGKMIVLVYPSTISGLDSSKHDMAGILKFVDVEKYDKTKNKNFSFEKKKSYFMDTKTSSKSYEVIKYKTKIEDHYYLIYTWQESMNVMSPNTEKDLFEVVNAIEPL
ncbi:MAG: hypothetical protein IPI93_01985 [Sphingobacteriaceae bacterium]|nr:hypothetical protein [Sphingobacteriaceae bacterium]MBK7817853.1 hypothetical protein [Sphingobacteriaceae bacterium]